MFVLNDPREGSQNILTKMTGMQVSQHRHKRHTLVAALERGGRQGLHDAVLGSAEVGRPRLTVPKPVIGSAYGFSA